MLYVIDMFLNNRTLPPAMSLRGHRVNWYRNTGFIHENGNDLFQEDSDLILNYIFNSVCKRWRWGRQVYLSKLGVFLCLLPCAVDQKVTVTQRQGATANAL